MPRAFGFQVHAFLLHLAWVSGYPEKSEAPSMFYRLGSTTHYRRVSSGFQEETKPGSAGPCPLDVPTRQMEDPVFWGVVRLLPFPQAITCLALCLQEVQALLHADLHELQELQLASQTDAQCATLDRITSRIVLREVMLSRCLTLLKEQWQRACGATGGERSHEREQACAVPG